MNETNETIEIEETKKKMTVRQKIMAKIQRHIVIGMIAITAMASNAAAVNDTINNATFSGVIDIINAIIPLFESLLDLIIAVFPLTIAMALLSALTLLITGIFYRVTKGTSK